MTSDDLVIAAYGLSNALRLLSYLPQSGAWRATAPAQAISA